MSIVKHLLGYTNKINYSGGFMIASENDFADFFILLVIISLTRFLFIKNEHRLLKWFHFVSIIVTSITLVATLRRYLWIELLITYTIIFYYHFRINKTAINKNILNISFFIIIILSSTLYVGVDKITDNKYVGRLITVLSLINPDFGSKYGSEMGHSEEISDGWYNVKNNLILGITPFGQELMVRFKTSEWQSGLFVHNGYLCIWLLYGLLGVMLFVYFNLKSLFLGFYVFHKFKNSIGLILLTFITCQMAKNIVWGTAILSINITIIYIVLISLVIKIKQLKIEE